MLPLDLQKCRIIDLTHVLHPGEEPRHLEIRRGIIEFDQTYMHDVEFHSHLGTHIETPAHFFDGGTDLAQLPVETFIGRAVLLSMEHLEPGAPITVADMEKAARGRVRPGDILLLHSPYMFNPWASSPEPDRRPYITLEAGQWMADLPIKMLGFDLSITCGNSVQMNRDLHEVTMGKDIPWIEVLENLDQITADEFTLIALPWPVKDLDSVPVRVVALEAL